MNCKTCGVPFTPRKRWAGGVCTLQVYCCRKCHMNRGISPTGRQARRNLNQRSELDCEVCGKPFMPVRSDSVCCSPECAHRRASMRRHQQQKESREVDKKQVVEMCVWCRNPFYPKLAKRRIYCTAECAYNARINRNKIARWEKTDGRE